MNRDITSGGSGGVGSGDQIGGDIKQKGKISGHKVEINKAGVTKGPIGASKGDVPDVSAKIAELKQNLKNKEDEKKQPYKFDLLNYPGVKFESEETRKAKRLETIDKEIMAIKAQLKKLGG